MKQISLQSLRFNRHMFIKMDSSLLNNVDNSDKKNYIILVQQPLYQLWTVCILKHGFFLYFFHNDHEANWIHRVASTYNFNRSCRSCLSYQEERGQAAVYYASPQSFT